MPARPGNVAAATQRHIVQFYGRDTDLIRTAGCFLAEALTSGGQAIVVATPAHRAAFGTWLTQAGVDIGAATLSGRYQALDAAGMLGKIMAAGRPDPVRFGATMGDIARVAAKTGRTLHIFGEMVSLLWEQGQVTGVLELEGLWNALVSEVPFSLFCAYPVPQASGNGDAAMLRRISDLHGTVIPAPAPVGMFAGRAEATRSFPWVNESPRAARRFVTHTLMQWGVGEFADDAAIVVTELATNAVVHARSGLTVTVSCEGRTLRICVQDTMPLPPSGAGPPFPAVATHGLGVVATVASRWRAEPAGNGKAVWADLQR